MKEYVNYSRCAAYPDVDRFEQERDTIEKEWPAYADDLTLSRLPNFFWHCGDTSPEEWTQRYHERLQHCLSRMNHHIHPLVNAATGTRRPLQSCLAKGKQECKADFPLENQMTDKALLVCLCIAEHMGLPSTGPRSMLGTKLPVRNNTWLNAGPRALVAFSGSNCDMKFPHRLLILHESHETLLFDLHTTPCYSPGDLKLQARDLQCAMSVVAGYFGGYTSKMQDIGQKEVKRLSLTLDRQLPSVVASKSQAQAFQY